MAKKKLAEIEAALGRAGYDYDKPTRLPNDTGFQVRLKGVVVNVFDKSKAWTFFGLPFEEPPMRVCDFAQQPPRLNVIVDRGTRRELRFRLGDFPHMV